MIKNLLADSDKKRVVGLVITLVFFTYAGQEIPTRFMFSFTDSIGYKLFYYTPLSDDSSRLLEYQIKKGDYVVFRIKSDHIPNCHPCNVVKRIGCDEGDRLYSTDRGTYFCGNNFLGAAKTHSKKGEPVDAFTYNGIVPKNTIFAYGGHKDSYDSRYFGFVDKSRILGVAIPLI